MFGRPFNEFWDFTSAHSLEDWVTFVDRRVSQWNSLHDTVIPAVSEHSHDGRAKARTALDKSRRTAPDFQVGDLVMAVDPVRTSKWHPVYTGPHAVGAVHRGGNYTLLDALAQPMEPRRTTDMLRLVSSFSSMDEPSGGEEKHIIPPKTIPDVKQKPKSDEQLLTFEVQTILDQRVKKGKQEYLVHWKNFPEKEATWEPVEHFDGQSAINRYWKDLKKKKQDAAVAQQPKKATRRAGGKN